jgi:ABC-2 type transport system ATP-binding protein
MNDCPLNIENIKKRFGKNVILDGINLSLKNNEIFGLIGLNGIGKTTLIKIILDLLDANDGTVEIFGKNSTLTESRKNLAYLPEKFQPSPFLKGREFLNIFCKQEKNEKLNLEKVYYLADLLALDRNVLDLRISKYSKGMIQKLGLVGTFLNEAKLVILDEPMSGLDPKARICLKDLLKECKNNGKTIFFSSHILADIDEICDRIGILHNKKICFTGQPKTFKIKRKENLLERAFLKEIGLKRNKK